MRDNVDRAGTTGRSARGVPGLPALDGSANAEAKSETWNACDDTPPPITPAVTRSGRSLRGAMGDRTEPGGAAVRTACRQDPGGAVSVAASVAADQSSGVVSSGAAGGCDRWRAILSLAAIGLLAATFVYFKRVNWQPPWQLPETSGFVELARRWRARRWRKEPGSR